MEVELGSFDAEIEEVDFDELALAPDEDIERPMVVCNVS
jgi:hypothetical protein